MPPLEVVPANNKIVDLEEEEENQDEVADRLVIVDMDELATEEEIEESLNNIHIIEDLEEAEEAEESRQYVQYQDPGPVGPAIRALGGVLQRYLLSNGVQVYNWTRDRLDAPAQPQTSAAISWSSPMDPSGTIRMSTLLTDLERLLDQDDPAGTVTELSIPLWKLLEQEE